MAKELPYFQFEPAEYLTKDISFCSLSAQGLFINICAYYWQRNCELTKEQVLRRLNYDTEFEELVTEGIIDVNEGIINIKFLDTQRDMAIERSKIAVINGSKGGRPITKTKPKHNLTDNLNVTQTKPIRRDKIKEEEKREDKKTISDRFKEFENDVLKYVSDKPKYPKSEVEKFIAHWGEYGKGDKKMRYEEMDKFFIGKRLATWMTNAVKYSPTQGGDKGKLLI